MGTESWLTPTVASMREDSKMAKDQAMEECISKMDLYMKAIGLMINKMGKGSSMLLMACYIKESGKMDSNMEMDHKNGQMEHLLQDSFSMGKNKEKEPSNGVINLITKVSSKIIISTVKELWTMQMADITKDCLKMEKWMDLESSLYLLF